MDGKICVLFKDHRTAVWSMLTEEEVQEAASKYPERIYFFHKRPSSRRAWAA